MTVLCNIDVSDGYIIRIGGKYVSKTINQYEQFKDENAYTRILKVLPTWICSCQSVGTVNFTLPFTTNATISISILQTFRT